VKEDDARKTWFDTHAGRGLSLAGFREGLAYGLNHHGPAKTLALAAGIPFRRLAASLRYRIDGRIDRRYGTDTQGRVPLASLAFTSENKDVAQPYEPTPELSFRRMMARLPRSLAGFTFLDIGCGKGRALFCAVPYDFARIIGIEFSPELAAIAARNAEKYANATGDRRIEVVCADATRFDPPSTPLVCYLFQPFNAAQPYRLLAETLRRSFAAVPRKMFVMLLIADWAPIFAQSGFLNMLAEDLLPADLRVPVRHRFAILETREP